MARKIVTIDEETKALPAAAREAIDARIGAVGDPKYLSKTEASATYAPVGAVPQAYQDYVAENSGGEAYPPVVYSVVDGQRVVPESTVACYGDSLTESTSNPWPPILATLTGLTVVNRGISGQGAADIILRQGGLQPRLTLAADIPAETTPVSVTVVDPADGWRTNGTGTFGFGGTLAGVPGTLIHNLVDGTWTFTRTTAGSATPVPAGTPFVPGATQRNPTAHQILWAGRNNIGNLAIVRDLLGLAIERGIETQVRRYLVVGVTNGTTEGVGTTNYNRIIEHNRLLKARYGKFFYDIRRDFIDRGLSIAGITPTADDNTAIADDRPPASLMADSLHPNAAGYQVVAQLIGEKLVDLGWVASLSGGVAAPTTAPTVTAGSSGSTSQSLSWTAVSGATSYKVEYRTQGSATWLTGPTATGTSASVTGLTAATAYEYRVAAVNSGGTGPWSATVSKSTAAAVTVITSDSFNRADTTSGQLGTTDAAFGGTASPWYGSAVGAAEGSADAQLQILGNQVGATSLSTTRYANVEVGSSDHYVEVVLAATTEGGVSARWTDLGNYYAVRSTSTGQIFLDARSGGTTTTLEQTATGVAQVGDRIGLLVRGSDITAYRNGVQILYRSDTRVTTGTRAGIRSSFSNAAFRLDNFRVATDLLTTPAV